MVYPNTNVWKTVNDPGIVNRIARVVAADANVRNRKYDKTASHGLNRDEALVSDVEFVNLDKVKIENCLKIDEGGEPSVKYETQIDDLKNQDFIIQTDIVTLKCGRVIENQRLLQTKTE